MVINLVSDINIKKYTHESEQVPARSANLKLY